MLGIDDHKEGGTGGDVLGRLFHVLRQRIR